MGFLGIDLGARRTGLAVGDEETGVVSPLESLEVPPGDALLAAIDRVAAAHGAGALVVGLPLNMDGTEGRAAVEARAFARRLEARTGLPVHLQDERLTTFEADRQLAGRSTRRQKKERRDALAAAQILKDFLSSRDDSG